MLGHVTFTTDVALVIVNAADAPLDWYAAPPRNVAAAVYVPAADDNGTGMVVTPLASVVMLAAVTCRMLDTRQIEIVLEQGKYHQAKRMLAAAGNHCVALCRTRIGKLRLDELGLAEGEWCYLNADHLASLVPD